MDWVVWIGIVVCLSQSAMFSGLNLGMLGSSRLRLQVAAAGGNKGARRTWIIIIDEDGRPRLVLNASVFLRAVLMNVGSVDPHDFCHEPVVIADPACKLESVLGEIRLRAPQPGGTGCISARFFCGLRRTSEFSPAPICSRTCFGALQSPSRAMRVASYGCVSLGERVSAFCRSPQQPFAASDAAPIRFDRAVPTEVGRAGFATSSPLKRRGDVA